MYHKLAAVVCAAPLLLCGTALQARTPQEEENLRIAMEFYDAGFNEKNWEKTATYMGRRYDQHSIYMADQREGLQELVERIGREFPGNRGEVKRAFVEGDLVVMHIHVTRYDGHPGYSVIEMIRIEDGKAVEHWDMFRLLSKVEEAEVLF